RVVTPRPQVSWLRRGIVIALALLAIGEAAYIVTLRLRAPIEVPLTGALFVQTQPAGAEILIDGQARGVTPFRRDLPPGQHVLELRKDKITRRFPLVLAAGSQLSQYVEMRTGESETTTSTPTPSTTPAPAPVAPAPVAVAPQQTLPAPEPQAPVAPPKPT